MALTGWFNRFATQGAANIASAEAEKRAREEAARQTMQTELARLESAANAKAQLDWLEHKGERIRDNYIELVSALEEGDASAVTQSLFPMGDLAPVVVSLPVLDSDGRVTSMCEWAQELFPDSAAHQALKKASADPASVLAEIRPEARHYEAAKQTPAPTAETVAEELRAIAEEMQVVTALIRLEKSLGASPKDMTATFKNHLPSLIDNYGLEKTVSWLITEKQDRSAPALLAIAGSNAKNPSAANEPFGAILAALPQDADRAAFLRQLATAAPTKRLEKELKILAAQTAGDFIRTGPLALTAQPPAAQQPLQLSGKIAIHAAAVELAALTPPAQDGSRKIRYVIGGELAKTEAQVAKAAEAAFEALARDSGMMRLTETGCVRPAEISAVSLTQQSGTNAFQIGFIIGGKQWNVTMPLAAAKEQFARLEKLPGFIATGDGDLLNPARIALIYWDTEGSKLSFVNDGGKQIMLTGLTAQRAHEIMSAINRGNASFVRHQRHALLNPDLMSSIAYDREEGKITYQIGGSSWQSSVAAKDAARVLKSVAARPHYAQLTDSAWLNLNKTGALLYNEAEERLEYSIGGKNYGTKMNDMQARRVLNVIEAFGRAQALQRVEKSYEGIELGERLSELKIPRRYPPPLSRRSLRAQTANRVLGKTSPIYSRSENHRRLLPAPPPDRVKTRFS